MGRVRSVIVALGLTLMAGCASVDAQQSRFTPEELDAFAEERSRQLPPRPPEPPPVVTHEERLLPLTGLVVCMSTRPRVPVYTAPDARSQTMGSSTGDIAVTGAAANGFTPVLHYNGKPGFVRASEVGPFKSEFMPGSTCRVAGLRPEGYPVFDYR